MRADGWKMGACDGYWQRIGCCIECGDLIKEQKNIIIDKWYEEIINCLNDDYPIHPK